MLHLLPTLGGGDTEVKKVPIGYTSAHFKSQGSSEDGTALWPDHPRNN